MAASLTVTKIHIASTRGANKRPSSGDVWFSDGQSYGFSRTPEDALRFFTHRTYLAGTREQHSVLFAFDSAKRATVLEAYLNTNG